MTTKSLSISSLLLDLENPRIVRAGSQRDALQRIIEDQDDKLAVLAESIVAQNGLNPMDRWLVLRQPDGAKFVVYEGNRRLAALKILSNPAVLGSLEIKPTLRKRFEKVARKFDVQQFGKVDCFVISSRAEGALWLHQRHTGANRGSGIVDWNGLATARFRGTDPALQALEAVFKFGGLDADDREELEDGFPITTLDRLLSSTAVRALIGVDVKQSKLLTDLPPPVVLKILTRIVLDLAGGSVSVSDVKNKAEQIKYIQTLGQDLPDLSLRTGDVRPIEDWDITSFQSPSSGGGGSPYQSSKSQETKTSEPVNTPKPQTAPKPRSHVRKTLIEKDCVLNVTNAKIREIEKELRTLALSTHRHAIAVLFRVFLETSIDVFLTGHGVSLKVTNGGHSRDKKLAEKVKEAIAAMVLSGVPEKHLDGVSKGIHDRNNAIYIDTLHAYVHNEFYSPKESDLSVAFDNARPFIEVIWK
ncbi:hypothetical protein HFN98_03820 [Rhizobium laguerreae]|uniref:hypothetical protein n=1 Tax=Rhizobium laguerreae TaxID=1076926 RepID=UPI001C91F9F3|nr:hypothetical protein [Rhizobium laguerreae]MBY3329782.1 hypothetical protein [Rhizobium laguerreae]